MIYLLLFAAQFAFVFLKAFQQKNVTDNHYTAVIPVSFMMAAMEVFVVAQVATTGWDLAVVAAVGLAGGTGAILAMLLHNHIFLREGGLNAFFRETAHPWVSWLRSKF